MEEEQDICVLVSAPCLLSTAPFSFSFVEDDDMFSMGLVEEDGIVISKLLFEFVEPSPPLPTVDLMKSSDSCGISPLAFLLL